VNMSRVGITACVRVRRNPRNSRGERHGCSMSVCARTCADVRPSALSSPVRTRYVRLVVFKKSGAA